MSLLWTPIIKVSICTGLTLVQRVTHYCVNILNMLSIFSGIYYWGNIFQDFLKQFRENIKKCFLVTKFQPHNSVSPVSMGLTYSNKVGKFYLEITNIICRKNNVLFEHNMIKHNINITINPFIKSNTIVWLKVWSCSIYHCACSTEETFFQASGILENLEEIFPHYC